MKDLLPIMYIRILEQQCNRIQQEVEGGFSKHMEKYQDAADKESCLRDMFSSVLGEAALPPIEPWVNTFGEESLQLFYKFVWIQCRQPEIDNFGRKFFLELCDT
jgi:hypothetical protein